MSLATDGIIAETLPKSCLICRHFRLTAWGRFVSCDQKPRIIPIPTEHWRGEDAALAARRGTACKLFDDMRPDER